MRIVEEVEAPISPEERASLVVHLMEMIDHWNAGIARHESYPEPDRATVSEFTDRRDSYVQQLAILLQGYGLNFQPGDHSGHRQVA